MSFGFRMFGLAKAVGFFNAAEVAWPKEVDGEVNTVGRWATAQIKAAAPVEFGDYRDSIKGVFIGAEFIIATDFPQGARLELGFNGVDRLGRRVTQGPRPHFSPVVDALAGRLQTHIRKVFE